MFGTNLLHIESLDRIDIGIEEIDGKDNVRIRLHDHYHINVLSMFLSFKKTEELFIDLAKIMPEVTKNV